jgi:hypothetical protein
MSSENINEGLIISYIKLLNSSFELYAKLPQWNKFPTTEELKNEKNLSTIHKKIMITLKILINKTKENKNDELNHLFVYAHNLLLDEETLKKTTKLNLLLCTAIIAQKIINEKDKQKYQEYMIEYLQMIMRNFHYAYNNSMYSYYESIANNIAIILHSELFFDYEYVFLYDREYFDRELIPKIKEEVKKIKYFVGEDLIKDFGFENTNYNDYKRLKDFSSFLEIAKTFEEFKQTHSKEEYIQMKEKLKEKFIPLDLKLG